jgi:hypothetical protein
MLYHAGATTQYFLKVAETNLHRISQTTKIHCQFFCEGQRKIGHFVFDLGSANFIQII